MAIEEPFTVAGDTQRVEAASVVRLPFEPKGTALELRAAIREALARLEPTGVLHAEYHSAVRSTCDVENVLFYNVGMSHFRRLASQGLVFERAFTAGPNVHGHPHRYRYETGASTEFRQWILDDGIASWVTSMPARGGDKPTPWWRAVRTSLRSHGTLRSEGEPFALVVRVGSGSRSLSSVLKPMFDGAIAALHADGAPDLVAVDRVADSLTCLPSEVIEMLRLPVAPLGDRRLVRRYRDGVQWNPADDRCVAGSLVIDDALPPNGFAGAACRVLPTTP